MLLFALSAVGLVCAELGNTSISIDTPTDVREEQPLFTGDALVGLPAPNPFTNETSLDFTLPVGNAVTIEVFDAVGKRIAVIAANEMFAAGQHSVRFDADMLPNGMYTIRFGFWRNRSTAQRSDHEIISCISSRYYQGCPSSGRPFFIYAKVL